MSDRTYFRYPNAFWVVTISFGMWLLTMSRFWPTYIPAYLGPLGEFGTHVGVRYPKYINYLFIAAWGLHIMESLLTIILCRRRMDSTTTAKWCVQTLLFGFASLIYLMPEKSKRK